MGNGKGIMNKLINVCFDLLDSSIRLHLGLIFYSTFDSLPIVLNTLLCLVTINSIIESLIMWSFLLCLIVVLKVII